MENLVRRLGRILSLKSELPERKLPQRTLRKMDLLEKALSRWLDDKGWRLPCRTVGEAAERMGSDSETLYYYFERRMGMDFRTWRTRLRIRDAMEMLRERPDLSVSEVGRRVGFSDRSNFSSQFLSYTGRTPAQWRKEAGISHDIPAPENDYV